MEDLPAHLRAQHPDRSISGGPLIVPDNPQPELADVPFAEFVFDADHPLERLAAAIDWKKLLGELSAFYSEDRGAPSTPLRAQVGTLMLKHLRNLPDRQAVRLVLENIYAQRFCGLSPAQVADYMHPASGLANFRAKIGAQGMALIEEALTAAGQGKSHKRGGKMILDTTCIPADILYPADIRLLERCRRAVVRLLQRAKDFGMEAFYRTYNRTARKVFVQFSKLGKRKFGWNRCRARIAAHETSWIGLGAAAINAHLPLCQDIVRQI